MVTKTTAAGGRLAEFANDVPQSGELVDKKFGPGKPFSAAEVGAFEKCNDTYEVREEISTKYTDKDVREQYTDSYDASIVADDNSVQSGHEDPKPGCSCLPMACIEQHNEEEIPSREKEIGFTNFFELIETACCGETKLANTTMECQHGKGKTFSELAACKNFNVQDLTEFTSDSESLASDSRYSTRSRRSGRRAIMRKNVSRKFQTEVPKERHQASEPSAPTGTSISTSFTTDIAKKASAFIMQNIRSTEEDESASPPNVSAISNDVPIVPVVKEAHKSAADEPTLITAESTAVESNTVNSIRAVTRDHERLREVCVLSLVCSGSTVSGFEEDDGGHSWSLHTKRKANSSSPSDMVKSDTPVASWRRAIATLVNFLDSLTRDIHASGVAAPVNKLFCFLCMTAVLILWPVDGEKNRRKVKQVEIPRPRSPVSLLKAVLRGETKEGQTAI
jgi:hypothetical protein